MKNIAFNTCFKGYKFNDIFFFFEDFPKITYWNMAILRFMGVSGNKSYYFNTIMLWNYEEIIFNMTLKVC